MSILRLYELVIARELTLAVRLTPMIDGYTVLVQTRMHMGPCPRFEKHFPPDYPVADAIDAMAKYPLDFFSRGLGGLPASRNGASDR